MFVNKLRYNCNEDIAVFMLHIFIMNKHQIAIQYALNTPPPIRKLIKK